MPAASFIPSRHGLVVVEGADRGGIQTLRSPVEAFRTTIEARAPLEALRMIEALRAPLQAFGAEALGAPLEAFEAIEALGAPLQALEAIEALRAPLQALDTIEALGAPLETFGAIEALGAPLEAFGTIEALGTTLEAFEALRPEVDWPFGHAARRSFERGPRRRRSIGEAAVRIAPAGARRSGLGVEVAGAGRSAHGFPASRREVVLLVEIVDRRRPPRRTRPLAHPRIFIGVGPLRQRQRCDHRRHKRRRDDGEGYPPFHLDAPNLRLA